MTYERFRRLCLGLPEAEERETWGESTFRVGGRIFAMGSPNGTHVSVKATLEDQAGLIAMDPKTFAVSAYTGRFGWVTVRLGGLGLELGERLVASAWKRTAPRRLVSSYEAEVGVRTPGADSRRDPRTAARSRAGSRRR